jgi:nucleotide-binding universal stress UspA family protein
MSDVATRSRFVVVLGRSTENLGDPKALVRAALDNELDVAVLSIGFPVTPQQQAFVAESVELAVESGIRLDAEILATAADLALHLSDGDDVAVASRGLERRRIEAILRKRGTVTTR